MVLPQNRIYLASRSPRRQDLLKQIGINFEVLLLREAPPRGADVNEAPLLDEPALDYTCRVARAKAETAGRWRAERALPYLPVLAADTAVMLKGRIFGKPENPAHAGEILRTLSGQTHQVVTAVALGTTDGIQVRRSGSTVKFRSIGECEIRSYLACVEAYDKAGAYAIQGRAAVFISEISGSYSGIVGLPLFETAQLLEDSGIKLFSVN